MTNKRVVGRGATGFLGFSADPGSHPCQLPEKERIKNLSLPDRIWTCMRGNGPHPSTIKVPANHRGEAETATKLRKRRAGFEPATPWLIVTCSTNWAIGARQPVLWNSTGNSSHLCHSVARKPQVGDTSGNLQTRLLSAPRTPPFFNTHRTGY